MIERLEEIRKQFAALLIKLSEIYALYSDSNNSVRMSENIRQKYRDFFQKQLLKKQTITKSTGEILFQNSKQIDYLDFQIDKKDISQAVVFDSGGFHKIYRLPEKKYKSDLAFKIGGLQNQHKIQNEIKILHSIPFCDNIVKAYRSKQFNEFLFMEYCQYKNLRAFLIQLQSVISLKTKLKILHQASLGVYHLHSQGIQHFDLKPDNILIDDKFTPKICDFGESFFVSKGIRQQQSKPYSIPYQAPECLQQHYGATLASDVFSFGVIIFEVVFSFQPMVKLILIEAFTRKQNYFGKFQSGTYEIEDFNFLKNIGPKYVMEAILLLSIQCIFFLIKVCYQFQMKGRKWEKFVNISVQSTTILIQPEFKFIELFYFFIFQHINQYSSFLKTLQPQQLQLQI